MDVLAAGRVGKRESDYRRHREDEGDQQSTPSSLIRLGKEFGFYVVWIDKPLRGLSRGVT